MSPIHSDPGSFRDPASTVLRDGDRVLRGLGAEATAAFEATGATTAYREAVAAGRIVGTRRLDPGEVPAELAGRFEAVLEHEAIPFISYPYEWSFSMLQDAGALHLELLLASLEEGITMKDGYSFNLQFRGAEPTFIDVGSFEPVRPGPWIGYRQYCQTFLYPLMLEAHLGVPFQRTLLGHLDGIPPQEMAKLLRGTKKYRKGVFRNVTVQAAADRRFDRGGRKTQEDLAASGFGAELNKALTKKLLRTTTALRSERSESAWVAYRNTCSYSDADREAKERFIREVVADRRPQTAWDLGANDGVYARIVAERSEQVLAVDYDDVTVDAMYRSFKADGVRNILPLVMNLVDPSPARGWRNGERRAFTERGRPDLVLALALIHHLALAANVPLPQIVEWFAEIGGTLVVEFVEPGDPMADRLLGNKAAGLFPDYRIEEFERLLGERYQVTSHLRLPSGGRTLYVAEPRG
ncbi:MAG: methyltransferase [Actinomycetes bacterium]